MLPRVLVIGLPVGHSLHVELCTEPVNLEIRELSALRVRKSMLFPLSYPQGLGLEPRSPIFLDSSVAI